MKKKQDARKLSSQAQEALRLRIVDYLKTGKGTQKQAAAIFAFSIDAIKKIWKRYKQNGIKALKRKKRGPHQCTSRLSKLQTKQITRDIRKGTPDSYQLPFYLWTADAVRRLIKKKHG
jgi:transposase